LQLNAKLIRRNITRIGIIIANINAKVRQIPSPYDNVMELSAKAQKTLLQRLDWIWVCFPEGRIYAPRKRYLRATMKAQVKKADEPRMRTNRAGQ
jgi:hypothetical protein